MSGNELNVSVREAARDLIDAYERGPHVLERRDLWRSLRHALQQIDEDPKSAVIAGVNVSALLDQCKRLAIRNSGSTMSFQYESAFENCIAVINALRDTQSALSPQPVTKPAMGGGEEAATHRHKKRGSTYALIGVGKMQADGWSEEVLGSDEDGRNAWVNESIDMREVAIYRSLDDGALWVRPIEEFEDGRFEALTTAGDEL